MRDQALEATTHLLAFADSRKVMDDAPVSMGTRPPRNYELGQDDGGHHGGNRATDYAGPPLGPPGSRAQPGDGNGPEGYTPGRELAEPLRVREIIAVRPVVSAGDGGYKRWAAETPGAPVSPVPLRRVA